MRRTTAHVVTAAIAETFAAMWNVDAETAEMHIRRRSHLQAVAFVRGLRGADLHRVVTDYDTLHGLDQNGQNR